jgi:hypothetical protein
MRTDPTDTGGLFVSRRPGTRPVHYREPPPQPEGGRRAFDGALAVAILVLMVVINLCFWGPLPLACLWLGGRTQWWSGSVGVGIVVAFAVLGVGLLLGLMTLKRLDAAWILVRRASGHDQRDGVIGRIFMYCCMVGVPVFVVWLLGFSGAQLSGGGVSL